jgi:hypothetical protein
MILPLYPSILGPAIPSTFGPFGLAATANTIKKVPERIMKHLATRIFKSIEKEHGEILPEINTDIPNYKAIEDHKEAKVAKGNSLPC